ncbi:MFS transporter, partial [Pyxidicoccus fallax]|uniref:MFS transporter n=1 Tax=Pyxidicoccus fallax TaxID=394095 RepID=UPI0014950565
MQTRASGEQPPRGGWRFLLRALGHRNYRLFFAGQSVSLVGTWLTRVATSWLVYRLTGSAMLLGVISFCGQIPTFLLGPFAGVLVDRWNRHRLLVVTQVLAMIQSLALAALALTGVIAVWHIAALMVFQGLINAFDMPGRQSFVVEMVEDRADLPNAIALNSSMFNAARLLGPSVAGALIALVGEGGCFLIDGISYLAVIGSLLAMRITPRPRVQRHQHVLTELKEGFQHTFHFPPMRALLGLVALVRTLRAPWRSRQGDAVLRILRREQEPLKQTAEGMTSLAALTHRELALAVGLYGMSAVGYMEFDLLRRFLRKVGSSSWDTSSESGGDGDSGSDGDSGGGDGGGGDGSGGGG